jgi:hypothetical protein
MPATITGIPTMVTRQDGFCRMPQSPEQTGRQKSSIIAVIQVPKAALP